MVQTLNLQQNGQFLMRVAIGRLPDNSEITIVFQTLAGVWLRDPVTLTSSEDADAETIFANYSRCRNGFCFADTTLSEAMIKALANPVEDQTAILSYTGVSNQKITLPIAINGFADAFLETTRN
jgi:invasion protein IalB